MIWIISVLFTLSLISVIFFFYYTIKYVDGIKNEEVKSSLVALYYDRMCLLGIVIIILIILIGVLL